MIWNPFKKKEPEQVQYGDKTGKQLARPRINPKTGEIELEIKDEKYALRSYPRHHVLHGPLVEMKRTMKNLVIESLAGHLKKILPYKIPIEQCCPFVKELSRVFDLVIEAEDEPAMKKLIGQIKDSICPFLQEDDAWRFRIQWALEKFDMNKIKLNKSDKYYFRGKSFKVDT